IRQTDTGRCPWHLIEGTDRRYKDMTAGQIIIDAIEERLANHREPDHEPVHEVTPQEVAGASTTILDHVDLNRKLDGSEYKKRLKKLQNRIARLAWQVRAEQRYFVALFEGWDAAGKGGAIRRLVAPVDPRLYRVISVAAPTDEELAHHYLWRFWRQIPMAGRMTIYDRSWYGRVLVERVEGFASPQEWHRAYNEINDFEEQLCEHGVILCKFWIHISAEEQLRRFKEREKIPWKKHKITDEDWRNRDKWPVYEQAINDMIARTSTEYAPWHIIAGNDKYASRVQVLDTVRNAIEASLGKKSTGKKSG
ncbi:MAG: hypothetical protein R3202_13855, partial [Candidatus Competibacterales bacterium]|nr:hypothetical protein [Candidatus Competibacterales bacterium]